MNEAIRQRLRVLRLEGGDVLLVQTSEDVLDHLRADNKVVVASDRLGGKFDRTQIPIALNIAAGVVRLLALEYLLIMVSAPAGVVAIVFLGLLRPTDCLRGSRLGRHLPDCGCPPPLALQSRHPAPRI